MKTADRARGKWRGILMTLGLEEKFVKRGRHGPCPFCEGKDRYRFDDKGGNGTFICSQCGAGDGFEILKRLKGWDFKTAAQEVDKIVGGVSAEPVRKPMDDQTRRDRLNSLWAASQALNGTDPASTYLASRGVAHRASCLRFHASCPKPHGEDFAPAMLAMVQGVEGNAVTIHRTFLSAPQDGKRQRALMPGELPDGCAVRLFPVGAHLGIAEGIETAIAAAKRFGIPVWAAINATMLTKWAVPHGVEQVTVFGDCDPAYGGQAAAYALAHRLAGRHRIKVDVRIPQETGKDWADADAA